MGGAFSKWDASAYGIFFDYAVNLPGQEGLWCIGSNPDIAGIGVVLSFVLAALTTTIASIAAAFLDAAVLDEKAFLPSKFSKWLNRGLSPSALEKRRLWRRVLDRLILGLADQQLVSGFALLVCGYVSAFPHNMGIWKSQQVAHWNLLVYMACLSSSTHLACVLTLRKYFNEHTSTGILRVALVILFSVFLIPSIIMSYCFDVFLIPVLLLAYHEINKGRNQYVVVSLWYVFQGVIYMYLFYAAIMQLLPGHQQKIRKWKLWVVLRRFSGLNVASAFFKWTFPTKLHAWFGQTLATTFWYLAFLGPGTVFVVQIFFSITALTFTLAQKFANPKPTDQGGCSLNTQDENQLGFGQLLAIIFLLLPLLAAWELYIEERNNFRKYSQLAQAGNGTYVHIESDAPLLPLTPMQQASTAPSYFQQNPAPSISHWSPTQQYGGALLSPPAPYYNSPEYSRLYSSP